MGKSIPPSGYVYVMTQGPKVKIGKSADPYQRSLQLNAKLAYQSEYRGDALSVEKLAHRVMALGSRALGFEWYQASFDDAVAAINIAIAQTDQRRVAGRG